MIITGMINVVLDIFFIFVFRWGVAGAALSTISAQGISMVYIAHFFFLKDNSIHLKKENLVIGVQETAGIFVAGFSTFFTQVASSLIAASVNNQLLSYANSYAVGAYGAINMTYSLVLMPVFGIGQGSQPIIGYNHGAKLYKRARQILYYSLLISFIAGIFGWLCFHLQSHNLMALFTNQDKSIMHYAVPGLEKLTMLFPLACVQAVGQVYFQAIGRPKITLVLSALRQLLFLIPSLFILPFFFGLNGVWYAIPVAEFLALACTSTTLFVVIQKMKKEEETQEI